MVLSNHWALAWYSARLAQCIEGPGAASNAVGCTLEKRKLRSPSVRLPTGC